MAKPVRLFLFGLGLLLISFPGFASANGSFVVSGQIIKPDGTNLTSPTVNFKVEVKDSAAGSCVLWSETFANTDMSATDGNFSLALGTGVRQDGGSHQLNEVFSNQKIYGVTGYCPAGYAPAAGDERSLKITFDDSGGATQTFTSQSVKPVPTASAVGDYGVANLAKISGVGSSNVLNPFQFDFLYKLAAPASASSTPCTTNDVLKFNGTAWICSAVAGGGVSNVSSANADITVATGSTTPVLTLNSGTGAGQIVKLDAGAKLPVIDASQVTNLNASALASGTIPAARLPGFTGDVTSSGTTTTIAALARSKIATGTANHVLINDGTGNLSSEANLAISRGGTGASTATGAINALVPTQTGNTGKVLSTDGTVVSWTTQSGGLPAAGGTAAAPGYAFTGNTNTGLFSPGANQIAFANNGIEKVRLDASGNMGIGTAAPGSALDVKGTLRLSGSTSGFVGFAPAPAAGSTTYTLPSADGTLNQVLQTNGAGVLSWGTPGGGGTVTAVSSANADIAVATGSSTAVLTLNSGTGPNQIVKLTAASKLPAVDGSLLTGLTTSQVSGVMQIAGGGTNSGTALSGNRLMVSSGGAIVEAAAMTDGQIVVGRSGLAPLQTAMSGDASINNAGAVTVSKLQSKTVAATAPSLGAYLKWNNVMTQWEPTYQSTCNGLNQVLHYTAATDGWACDTLSADNILPTQTGNSGKVLGTNGTTTSWVTPSGGLPAIAGTAAAPGYAFSGNTNTGVFGAAANQVGIATNGVERIRVDASGNVGVGTTTPLSNLHVKGVGAYAETAIQDSTGVTTGLTVGLSNNANGLGVGEPAHTGYLNNSNSAPLALMTNNVVRVMIDSVGNVGVGTNSPSALLHVNGTMRVTQICDSAGGNCKTVSGGWGSALSALSVATATNTIDNTNFAQTWNWSSATTQNPMSMSANAITTGSLLKLTTSSASFNSTSGLLNVANTSASTAGTVARIQSNSTAGSGLSVLANGNVGVGTTTPATMLDVSGAVKIGFDGSSCAAGIQGAQRMNGTTMEYCNGTSWQAYGVASTNFGGDVSGAYNATSVDKIKGKAVSVTAPTTAQFLVYDGTTQYSPVSLGGDATMSNSGAMTISANAITTAKMFSNPGVNRIVATDNSTGATLAPLSCSSGNLLTWNVGTGWQCTTQASLVVGSAASVTGTVPVASGGTGTTTGSITGTGALSFTAGAGNNGITLSPSGSGIVSAVGNFATYGAISSTGPIAGTGAIDTASKFTVNGSNALVVNANTTIVGATTASVAVPNQTAVGAGALAGSSGTGYSTAVGVNSLAGSTTGAFNTGVGFGALQTLDTGSYNTALGWGAASSIIQGGNNNTLIGSVARVPAAVTSNGTAIGYNAQTADSAVAVGANSDAGMNGIAIGSGATASAGDTSIGSTSSSGKVSIFAGSSERLRIDSFGDVGIGTTAPVERFEVAGGARLGQAPTTLTTLSAVTTTGQTSMGVVSTSGYPTVGTLLIDSEAMTYTGVTGTSFTGVSRGVFGTTAAIHSSGATVNNYLLMAQGTSSLAPKMVVTGAGKVGIGTAAPGVASSGLQVLDVNGPVRFGAVGTTVASMGVCQTAPFTPTNTATAVTCTGVPASTFVSVSCSASAAFTTPNSTVIYARATGTADQISVNLSAANAVTLITFTCMWMKP